MNIRDFLQALTSNDRLYVPRGGEPHRLAKALEAAGIVTIKPMQCEATPHEGETGPRATQEGKMEVRLREEPLPLETRYFVGQDRWTLIKEFPSSSACDEFIQGLETPSQFIVAIKSLLYQKRS
jgi:hypothetical protein